MIITKTVYEEYFRYRDFSSWLTQGETLDGTPAVIITDSATGEDTSNSMVSSIAVYNNTQVRYKLLAGVAGSTYNVSIRTLTTNNQKFEDKALLLKVI